MNHPYRKALLVPLRRRTAQEARDLRAIAWTRRDWIHGPRSPWLETMLDVSTRSNAWWRFCVFCVWAVLYAGWMLVVGIPALGYGHAHYLLWWVRGKPEGLYLDYQTRRERWAKRRWMHAAQHGTLSEIESAGSALGIARSDLWRAAFSASRASPSEERRREPDRAGETHAS